MPRSYNGTAASADFATPLNLILDGENWVDTTINVVVLQPILDRISWLKANAGILDVANVWTARQHFNGGANIRNATLQIDGTGDIGVGDTVGSIDIHDGCDVFWQSGARGTVKSGASFHVVSGATLLVDAGSTSLVQFNACTIDGTFETLATAAATIEGSWTRSGNSAVEYERHTLIADAVTVHIDCTADEYRVPDSVATARVWLVDAPPDPAKQARILVTRSVGADTNQITLRQGTGCADSADIAFGNPAGHATFTEFDGTTTSGRWTVELIWSATLTKWRMGPKYGCIVPAAGAV